MSKKTVEERTDGRVVVGWVVKSGKLYTNGEGGWVGRAAAFKFTSDTASPGTSAHVQAVEYAEALSGHGGRHSATNRGARVVRLTRPRRPEAAATCAVRGCGGHPRHAGLCVDCLREFEASVFGVVASFVEHKNKEALRLGETPGMRVRYLLAADPAAPGRGA